MTGRPGRDLWRRPGSQLHPVCGRVMGGRRRICAGHGAGRAGTVVGPAGSRLPGSPVTITGLARLSARAWAGAAGVRRRELSGGSAPTLCLSSRISLGEDGDPGDAGPAAIRARRPRGCRDQTRWKEVRRGRKRSPRPAPPPARKPNSRPADAPSSPSRTGLERWPSPPGGRPSVAERGSVQSGAAHTSLPRSAFLARTQGGSPPSCITHQR